MPKFTRQEKKAINNGDIGTFEEVVAHTNFNQFKWTKEQVQRASQILARKVANSIGTNAEDLEDSLFQIEDALNLQWPNHRGYLWTWWTEQINRVERQITSLNVEFGEISTTTHTDITEEKTITQPSQKEHQINENYYKNYYKLPLNKTQQNYLIEQIETFLTICKMYGRGVIEFDANKKIFYFGLYSKIDGATIEYQTNGFYDTNFFNFDNNEIKFKKDKVNFRKTNIQNVVFFSPRANNLGDISWTFGRSLIPILLRFQLMGETGNCVSKVLQKVKDEKQAKIMSKKWRNIFSRFINQPIDPQALDKQNEITSQILGENVSKQLLDLIQVIKFVDEDYSKFIGEPSAGYKRQSLSGEFASGQSNWIYEYDKLVKRVQRFLDEINEKWSLQFTMNNDLQPHNLINDFQNGGKQNNRDGNENAEKEEATTATIKKE